jgi:N-acetylglucosamine-6-phosphate deacetylase
MIKAIVNGAVYTPEEIIDPGVVLTDRGVIRAVGSAETTAVPAVARRIDADGKLVVPGLIDLHIHGLLGYDGMGGALAQVIQALPAFGVTAFLGTTLTRPPDETLARLEAMAEVLAAHPVGAQCLGIHLEGPFLSPEKAGMAKSNWFEPLTWERFQLFQRAARGHIRLVTFAPEMGRAMEHIPRLHQAGVISAVGHSNATFSQMAEAVQLGLRHAAHTFNAMGSFHHRAPGVAGAALHFDEIVAELVADGVHVHPAAMSILLQAKGIERVALVSDASPLAGLPDGEYEWGRRTVFVRDHSCRLADGTIAGAHALLDTGLRNLVALVGLPLEQALRTVTHVPAKVLGLRKGRLAPGYDADILLLDDDLRPALTLVRGQIVFDHA